MEIFTDQGAIVTPVGVAAVLDQFVDCGNFAGQGWLGRVEKEAEKKNCSGEGRTDK